MPHVYITHTRTHTHTLTHSHTRTHTQDGRLKKNDQILCVNRENLLGGSNQEALDKLRSALSEASSSSVEAIGGSVELVVARRVHSPGSSMSPSMAALGEEPEEVNGCS